MVRVNWTDQAVNDLKEIAEYISKDSKRYAKIQIQRIIRQRTHILKQFQLAGQKLEVFGDLNIRQLVEGSYVILYHVKVDNQVDILTVHHSSRDLNQRALLF
ncbi:type II toxin-antitoxin system RelE/ParE family toxin [Algoriphagus yeomjeoni]|uniref:Addiction module RelE/StbE family toxin n=1 Tax=Algoriphagus yeomjeoni TaxID=291403 RepID=A0A327PJ57_9BACT|nr:type II toxin-antitoxin system RelE/ParE family toxin [Algoriphagus yeomjeoni]RAI92218.1 addiction module RelE/StbE family toxin [Algoriphagus yeomjeoni]